MYGGGVHFPTTFSKKIKIRSQLLELAVKSQKKKTNNTNGSCHLAEVPTLKTTVSSCKTKEANGERKSYLFVEANN